MTTFNHWPYRRSHKWVRSISYSSFVLAYFRGSRVQLGSRRFLASRTSISIRVVTRWWREVEEGGQQRRRARRGVPGAGGLGGGIARCQDVACSAVEDIVVATALAAPPRLPAPAASAPATAPTAPQHLLRHFFDKIFIKANSAGGKCV